MPTQFSSSVAFCRCFGKVVGLCASLGFIAGAAQSCTHANRGIATDHLDDGTIAIAHDQFHPITVVGEKLAAGRQIGDPRQLLVHGTWLWVADRSGDPYLHLIDLARRQATSSRGTSGEGPGDFAEVPQLTVRPGDRDGVWTYDAALRRLTREVPAATNELATVIPEDRVERVWSLAWIDREHLIGIGDLDTNRVMVLDSAGKIQRLVPSRILGPDSVPVEARRAASSGYSVCIVPEAERVALLYLFGGRIDIHDRGGRFVRHALVPFASDGSWVRTDRHQIWYSTDWKYYVGCAGTSRLLYALFAGHRTDGPGGGRTVAARHVHVFDWSGNLIAVLRLDRQVGTIAVSGDTILYAAGQETDGVVMFRLPALLSAVHAAHTASSGVPSSR